MAREGGRCGEATLTDTLCMLAVLASGAREWEVIRKRAAELMNGMWSKMAADLLLSLGAFMDRLMII